MPALRRPAEPHRAAAQQHSRGRHTGSSAWNAFCLEVSGDRHRSQSLDPVPIEGAKATLTDALSPPQGVPYGADPVFSRRKKTTEKADIVRLNEQRHSASMCGC